MNSLKKFALVLLLFIGSMSSSFAQKKVCVPANMVIASTVTACDPGYTGSKFKRSIVTCPDGKVTTSDWDTTQCVANGSVKPPTACQLNPILCAGTPNPSGCPSGQHWSMTGRSYAHCVKDDFACPWGTTLQHDNLGNATTCKQNTCPSNQVLQGDGVACGCPASLSVWNGTACVAPCLSHTGDVYKTSCPAGQWGQIGLQDTLDCNNNVLSTATISNDCVKAATCPASSTSYVNCPSGQTGQVSVTTSYTVSNNACVPNTVTDSSNCKAIQCPASSKTTSACPSGQTGQIVSTTSYSVINNACVPSTINDASGCQTITCPPTATSYGACPAGTTGQSITTTTYAVINNACTPTSWTDYSQCVAIPAPTFSCPAKDTSPVPWWPMKATIAEIQNTCTGNLIVKPGVEGAIANAGGCSTGQSGCHCSWHTEICRNGQWVFNDYILRPPY